MNKKLVVHQNGYKDCGPSCLLSIMRYYGLEASHEEVSFSLRTNENGTSAYNIINGSKLYGFDGYGIHYTSDEIINNEINFPIICHVLKNNYYHFIVIYSKKKKYLEIMDPSSNISLLSFEEFKKIYLGSSLVIFPVKKVDCFNKYKNLKNFVFDYIKLEYINIIKILILSYIVIVLGIITNYYMLISIDYVLPEYIYYKYLKITIVFLIMYITKNILNYIRNKYLIYVENTIYKKINSDIIRKFFNLPYQFFKNKSTGEIISRLSDLKVFKELLSEIVVTLLVDLLLILISFAVLVNISIKLFMIILFQLLIYIFIVIIFKNKFSIKNENMLIKEGEYNKIISENINGYETNKNLNMINYSIKKIDVKFNSYIDSSLSYKNILNKQNLFKTLIVDIFYLFIIFLGITMVSNKIISLGEFILFNTIVYYFAEPIKNIVDLYPEVNYLKNIYRRINDLLIVKNDKDILKDIILKEDIVIEDLSYSYDGYKKLFDNVSLKIKYGTKYLLYGESGIGKSTIIKILIKYINDYEGDIYFGDLNLKDISKNSLLDNIVYVSQNSYVNHDTLKNNIVYDRNISDLEYERVLEICNLKELRNNKKMRNDFLIEDNGFNISGGERQKIILARSLLNRFNYLILDEALSEVDYFEEKQIINRIFDIYHDKTIIYISHKKEIINMFKDKYKLERSNSDKQ